MRLFLAIEPDGEVRRRLAEVIDALRSATSGVRWTPADKLHLTLAFFGNVDEAGVQAIVEATARVVDRHAPFAASISGAGVFPQWRKPRVIWLGLRDAGTLERLADDSARVFTDLGFPRDHPFRAHLTIGRVPQPLSALQHDALRKALTAWTASHPFDVTRVVLMQSTLEPSGSVYSALATFPLGGA